MFLAKLSIKRPVAMLTIILMLVIMGIFSYFKLPVDLFPCAPNRYITINTIRLGVSVPEVVQTIVKPIEEAVCNVNGIKNVESFASENFGKVVLEFNYGVNIDRAVDDVRSALYNASCKDLSLLENPVITIGHNDDNYSSFLVLEGNQNLETIRNIAESTVKESLLRISDVASVSIIGGQKREIQVDIQKQYGEKTWMSIDSIANVIASQIKNISIGSVSGNSKEYMVTVQGDNESLEQIKNVLVPIGNGNISVPLGSIANVNFANSKLNELCRINGQECVGIGVVTKSDVNAIIFTNDIKKSVKQLNEKLPNGMLVKIVSDKYSRVINVVNTTSKNIWMGLILVALMLLPFVGGFRLAFITVLTTLISVIITFNVLYFANYSLNILISVSLIILMFIMITNAIITIKAVQKYIDTDMSKNDAVLKGVRESYKAIAVIVLAVIAIFIPSIVVHDQIISLYKMVGVVFVSGVVVSFFLCLTLVPLVSKLILGKSSRARKIFDPVFVWIESFYVKILRVIVRCNVAVIVLSVAFCAFSVWYLVPKIGVELFSQKDTGTIQITIKMLSGVSFTETSLAVSEAERRIAGIPEIEFFYSTIYNNNANSVSNVATIDICLKKEHEKSLQKVINDIKPLLTEIPDAKISIMQTNPFTNTKIKSDIAIEVTGENIDSVLCIADTVVKIAQTVNGLTDIVIVSKEFKTQVKLIPNKKLIDEYGITMTEVGRTVKAYLLGKDATFLNKDNIKYNVRVQYAENDQKYINDLENIPIFSPLFGFIPLKAVSKVEYTNENYNLNRKNGLWLATVNLNVTNGDIRSKITELKKLLNNIVLQDGNTIQYHGEFEKIDNVFNMLFWFFISVIVLLFMAFVGSFESIHKSLIVMVTILFGIVGCFGALFITGYTISLIFVMSLILQTGMIVSGVVLLIVNIERIDNKDNDYLDSVVNVCKENFRMIVAIGLVPILTFAFLTMHSESNLAVIAVTFIGGYTLSALAGLFVVPAFLCFRK